MRRPSVLLPVVSLALLGACGRSSDSRPDDALRNDLALAAQAQPYQPQQFVSPSEQQLGTLGGAPPYPVAGQAGPQIYRAPGPVYRAPARRTSSRSPSRSTSRGASGGGYYPSIPSAPREPVRHTRRDAAIGAGAGAIIGAVTSRDRVKGGLIGAAAGGILGGIIGHTVDIQRP